MYVLSPLASISVKFGHKGQTQKTVFFYGESFIRNQLRKNQEHRRFFLRGTVRSCFPGFLLLSDTAIRTPPFVVMEKITDALGGSRRYVICRWCTIQGMKMQLDAEGHGIVGDGRKLCRERFKLRS